MKQFTLEQVVVDRLEENGLREHLTQRKKGHFAGMFDRRDGKGHRHFVCRFTDYGLWTCYGPLIIADPDFFEKFDAFCKRVLEDF